MPTPSAFIEPPAAGQPPPPQNTPVVVPPPASMNIQPLSASSPAAPEAPPPAAASQSLPVERPPVEPPPGNDPPAAAPAGTREPPVETVKVPANAMDMSNDFAAALENAAKTEDDKITAAAKPKEEAKPAPAAKVAEGAPATPAADSFESKVKAAEALLPPTAGSNTRKAFEAQKAVYLAEIAATKKLAEEATALRQQKAELETKLADKQVELPEPTRKELEELRAFRRTVDVTKDPEFVAKYDGKITANSAKIEAMLTDIGKAGGAKPEVITTTIAAYKKDGLTLDTLAAEITSLQKNGQIGQAERLKRLAMENEVLQEGRQAEIAEWEKDSVGRTAKQQEQQTTLRKQLDEQTRAAYAATFNADVEAYTKEFPALAAPPAPADTDAPAVKQAKQQALDAYTEALGKARQGLNEFFAAPKNAQEAANRNGRLYATAAVGLAFKNLIAPTIIKQLTALQSENEALKKQLAAGKKAGDLSGRHIAEITQAGGKLPVGRPGLSLAEQLAEGLAAAAQTGN